MFQLSGSVWTHLFVEVGQPLDRCYIAIDLCGTVVWRNPQLVLVASAYFHPMVLTMVAILLLSTLSLGLACDLLPSFFPSNPFPGSLRALAPELLPGRLLGILAEFSEFVGRSQQKEALKPLRNHRGLCEPLQSLCTP